MKVSVHLLTDYLLLLLLPITTTITTISTTLQFPPPPPYLYHLLQHHNLPWQEVALTYPWKKDLALYLRDVTEHHEQEIFREKMARVRVATANDAYRMEMLKAIKTDHEERVKEVLTMATVRYLTWRKGGSWEAPHHHFH